MVVAVIRDFWTCGWFAVFVSGTKHFVDLAMQISRQAQHFVNLEVQIS